MHGDIAGLADLLVNANYCIAFTGAGISTESGIPDFRSKGEGLWEKINPELLSVHTLRAEPALFYRHWRQMEGVMAGKQPNAGHLALVELAKLRCLRGVVTQNIDGLHQAAGSKRVFEVHGNLERCRCLQCKTDYPYTYISQALAAGAAVPLSPCCGVTLRPGVVLFGDRMADDFAAAREEAFRSDFCLVVGTSLTVYPAAEIPITVGRFAVINREETALDHHAALRVSGPIGEVLTELVAEVLKRRNAS